MSGVVRRLRIVLAILSLSLAFGVTPLFGHASPALANTTGTGVCGILSAYVPATPLSVGQIVIGNTTYAIASGTNLSLSVTAYIGQNVCLNATFNGSGQIIGGTLTAYSSNTVAVCGVVTAFVSPSPVAQGYITINGQTYPIAPNNSLGLTVLTLGSSYCLNSALDSLGELVGGTLSPASVQSLYTCGVVAGYIAASTYSFGSILIGGQTYVIAPGVSLGYVPIGGTIVCLNGSLNAAGQITSGTFGSIVGGTTSVSICGTVGGYTPSGLSTAGSIVLSGQTYVVAPGVAVNGAAYLLSGATVCLNGSANSSNQLVVATVSPATLAPFTICGVVSAYTPATNSVAGTLTIGGQHLGIAPGVTLGSAVLLAAGSGTQLCLQATLNGAGQITTGSFGFTSTTTPTVNVCGAVTAYKPATPTLAGSITVAGTTLAITAGALFVGATQPAVGSTVCLTLVVSSSNSIVGGTVINTSNGIPLSAVLAHSAGTSRGLSMRV